MTGQNEKPLRLPKPLSLRAPQGRGNPPLPAMRSIALTVRSIKQLYKPEFAQRITLPEQGDSCFFGAE